MKYIIQLLVVLMFYVDCFSSAYIQDPWSSGSDSSEYFYNQYSQKNNYNESYKDKKDSGQVHKNDNSQNNKDSLDNAKIYAQYFLIPDYKPLKEGFNIIGESFYDYINELLIKKYPGKDDNQKYLFIPHIDEVIEQAQCHLAEKLHKPFVVGMYQAIDDNFLGNIKDLKCQYVIKYSNSWMRRIVQEWVIKNNYEFQDNDGSKYLYIEALFLYAIRKNADVILKFFINSIGVKINEIPFYYDHSPLIISVMANADRVAKLLIEKGADIKEKNLMFEACRFLADKVAKVFIEAGVDLNELNYNGYTPLYFILNISYGLKTTKAQNIAKMLRDAGAQE